MRSGSKVPLTSKGELPSSIALLSEAVSPQKTFAKPHIMLMVDQFARVLGGGERIVLRTAELLTGAGYRVSILTFAVDAACTALEDPPCPVYVLPLTSVLDWNALRSAFLLGRFLRGERVDLVQTYFESANLFGGIVTRVLSRAKLLWSFRDMGILRARKHRLAYRLLARMPHAVLAVSEQVRRHAIEVDHIPAGRVSVVYNGLDLDRWMLDRPRQVAQDVQTGAGTAERPWTILSLGNIRAVKGHDVLVEAAAKVLQRFPHARFQVAGEVLEPEFFLRLQSRLGELGIADSFTFLGGVTDLPPVFQQADLFVLPSRSEGFSNAILEAMAASLPVVATDVGGNGEAVRDGQTGSIVPAEDPAVLAEAISALLADPASMKAMGRAGRGRIQEIFTSRAMLLHLESTYRCLLASRR